MKRWILFHDVFTLTGYASGLPGNVHSVRLCGALLLCVSPGGHVRSYQQHHRDPQWRPEALHRPAETLRTEGGEHRTMAGQCVSFWKMSAKPSGLRRTSGGHLIRSACAFLPLSLSFCPHQTAMEAMGLIAIIVNCYLIGQCGQLQRLFPWLSPEMTIISIVLLEVCAVMCAANAGLSLKGFVVLRECSFVPQMTFFLY